MKTHILKRVAWQNVIYLSLCPVVTFVLLPIYLWNEGFQWQIWAFFLVSCFLTTISITGGYHRLFAHKSYEAGFWLRLFYLFVGTSAFQGSALKWATDHRRHHRYVDTPDDPYNINQGFLWAHIGWLVMEDNPNFKDQWAQDLAKDRLVQFQHRYYFLLVLLIGIGLPTLIGYFLGSALGGFTLGAGLRLFMTNHSTFFINSLCHYIGKQPYTDQNTAKDSFIMAILACGEGYHNFHHRFQSDYRNGVRWYHFDPTKWWVSVCAWLGQAHSLKRTPSHQIFKARLEMDEKRMIKSGIPQDQLVVFRQKIEFAQERWRQLKLDYKEMKQGVRDRSEERMKVLKLELRQAKRELRNAVTDWSIVRKRPRLILAASNAQI